MICLTFPSFFSFFFGGFFVHHLVFQECGARDGGPGETFLASRGCLPLHHVQGPKRRRREVKPVVENHGLVDLDVDMLSIYIYNDDDLG